VPLPFSSGAKWSPLTVASQELAMYAMLAGHSRKYPEVDQRVGLVIERIIIPFTDQGCPACCSLLAENMAITWRKCAATTRSGIAPQ
jgi:hypothetical protein